jgi:hypothetical protein
MVPTVLGAVEEISGLVGSIRYGEPGTVEMIHLLLLWGRDYEMMPLRTA